MDRKYAIQITGIIFLVFILLFTINDKYIYTFTVLFNAYFLSSAIGNTYALIRGRTTFQLLVKNREVLNLVGALLVIPNLFLLPKKYFAYTVLFFIMYSAIGIFIGWRQKQY